MTDNDPPAAPDPTPAAAQDETLARVLDEHQRWAGSDGRRAELAKAGLARCNLAGRNLAGADLTGTQSLGTDLTDDRNLTPPQLQRACDVDAALPPNLRSYLPDCGEAANRGIAPAAQADDSPVDPEENACWHEMRSDFDPGPATGR